MMKETHNFTKDEWEAYNQGLYIQSMEHVCQICLTVVICFAVIDV